MYTIRVNFDYVLYPRSGLCMQNLINDFETEIPYETQKLDPELGFHDTSYHLKVAHAMPEMPSFDLRDPEIHSW